MAITLGEEPTIRYNKSTSRLCTKARLYDLAWFLGGVFTVLILLQIQANYADRLSFVAGTVFDPKKPQSKPQHKNQQKQTQTIIRTITHQASTVTLPASTQTVTLTSAKSIPSSSSAPSDTAKAKGSKPWSSFKQAFVFGDSYSSNSFKPQGKQPSDDNPLGNTSNGSPPNWVRFLTTFHNMSHVRSYDFAVGGSTVDRNVVTPYLLGTSFREQYRNKFQRYYLGDKPKETWDPDATVFFMWYCVNDLYGGRSQKGNWQLTRTNDIMNAYEDVSEKLYSDGARHMVFLNCPPFEKSLDDKPEKKLNLTSEISSFNARMIQMRTNLRLNHDDLNVLIFDSHSLWSRVIDAPQDFDETNTVKYPNGICRTSPKDPPFPRDDPHSAKCTNGMVREFLWYGLHGTFPMHNITAARLASDCFGQAGPSGFCS